MRFFAIPILILLVMSQTFSTWFVVISFRLNRDYIAKNLCENRNRPALRCKGNCVLMKKMQEEEKKEQNQPAPKTEINTIVLSSRTFFTANIPVISSVIRSARAEQPAGKPVDRSAFIFHPPCA
jgi:hypothetical protein